MSKHYGYERTMAVEGIVGDDDRAFVWTSGTVERERPPRPTGRPDYADKNWLGEWVWSDHYNRWCWQLTVRNDPRRMSAGVICDKAAELVSGDRDRQHGSKRENFQNIADMLNAYFGSRLSSPILAREVGLLFALMKIARTKTGTHNLDDYVDLAGYAGCAGEIAEEDAGR